MICNDLQLRLDVQSSKVVLDANYHAELKNLQNIFLRTPIRLSVSIKRTTQSLKLRHILPATPNDVAKRISFSPCASAGAICTCSADLPVSYTRMSCFKAIESQRREELLDAPCSSN